MSYTIRSGGPDFAPCAAVGGVSEHSSSADAALGDKLWTISLKLSHRLKKNNLLLFSTFSEEPTPSHSNLKTVQKKGLLKLQMKNSS